MYDVVLLDGTPSNLEINNSIIKQSKILLIPLLPSKIDFLVTKRMVSNLQTTVTHYLPKLSVHFLVNQITQTNISKEILVWLDNLPYPKLITSLKSAITYKKANEVGKGVMELANSTAKTQMEMLYNELLSIVERVGLIDKLIAF